MNWRDQLPPDFEERGISHDFWTTLIADALDGEREFELSTGDRVDVYVEETGEALEVKNAAQSDDPEATFEQVERYEAAEEVEAVILCVPAYRESVFHDLARERGVDLLVLEGPA